MGGPSEATGKSDQADPPRMAILSRCLGPVNDEKDPIGSLRNVTSINHPPEPQRRPTLSSINRQMTKVAKMSRFLIILSSPTVRFPKTVIHRPNAFGPSLG